MNKLQRRGKLSAPLVLYSAEEGGDRVADGAPNLPHKGLNKAFKQAFHKASPPLRANVQKATIH